MNGVSEKPTPASPSGDRIGAEDLFRAHASYVAGFIRRLGARHDEVDDLVQEVFLVAHRKGGYVRGPARPQSWLCAIAVRLAASRKRSAARSREEAASETVADARGWGKSPAEELEIRQSLDRVQAALSTLDVDARAAFILYEIEKEPCDVIASLLEVPVGTVYSRLHHARRRFLAAYEAGASGPLLAKAGGV